MSTETLRRAAALMRMRAELPYVKGEWEAVSSLGGIGVRKTSRSKRIAYPWHLSPACSLHDPGDEKATNEAIAEHVASWDPVVAEAVALLLENEANAWDAQDAADPEDERPWLVNHARRDLLTAVARTYLGESA